MNFRAPQQQSVTPQRAPSKRLQTLGHRTLKALHLRRSRRSRRVALRTDPLAEEGPLQLKCKALHQSRAVASRAEASVYRRISCQARSKVPSRMSTARRSMLQVQWQEQQQRCPQSLPQRSVRGQASKDRQPLQDQCQVQEGNRQGLRLTAVPSQEGRPGIAWSHVVRRAQADSLPEQSSGDLCPQYRPAAGLLEVSE